MNGVEKSEILNNLRFARTAILTVPQSWKRDEIIYWLDAVIIRTTVDETRCKSGILERVKEEMVDAIKMKKVKKLLAARKVVITSIPNSDKRDEVVRWIEGMIKELEGEFGDGTSSKTC